MANIISEVSPQLQYFTNCKLQVFLPTLLTVLKLIFCPHKRDTWSSRILREKQGALSHRISTEEGALSHRVSTEDLLCVGTVKVGYNQSISVKVLDWGEG